MAQVVYPRPSPWLALGPAIKSIMDPLVQMRQGRLEKEDFMRLAGLGQPMGAGEQGAAVMGAGEQAGAAPQPKSWADILPLLKSEKYRNLAALMLLKGRDRGTTVLDPTGKPVMQTRDEVKILQQQPFRHVAPGSLYQDPNTGEWKQAPTTKENIREVKIGDELVTFRDGQEIARAPRWAPDKGISLEVGPEGGVKFSTGGKVPGMGTAPSNKVQQDLLAATAGLMRMNQIYDRFDPAFATYGGQFEGLKSRIKEKAGYQLQPQEQEFLGKFSAYRAEAGQMLADTLKELSGAAVTPQEAERQKVWMINPGEGLFDGDSPTQVRAKIDRFRQFQKRAIARLNYINKHGLSLKNVPLESMEGIINRRAQALEKQMQKRGMDPETIPNAVRQQLAEEFGLVN